MDEVFLTRDLVELEEKAMDNELFWSGVLDFISIAHRENGGRGLLDIVLEYLDVCGDYMDEDDFDDEYDSMEDNATEEA